MSHIAFVTAAIQHCTRGRSLVWVPLLMGSAAAWTAPAVLSLPSIAGPQRAAISADIAGRVDLVQGRASLVTESTGHVMLRRGGSKRTLGDGQIELAGGCQVRISLDKEVTVDVFGPSSLAWSKGSEGVVVKFHELGWVDVDVRSGQHSLELPGDWTASFGRSSFHLRSLAGGPSELRHNAGSPVTLVWYGDKARVRPPVTVYAGSSVRLDRPRYERTERVSASQDGSKAWTEDDRAAWPWRQRADTAAQAKERVILSQETQVLGEIPGAPGGEIARLRAYEVDGSSWTRSLRGRMRGPVTYAQVPVAPVAVPRVEITARPVLGEVAHGQRGSGAMGLGSLGGASGSMAKEPVAVTSRATMKVAFAKPAWRGLERSALNGVGAVAAERGSSVEVRVLTAGRTKVFVRASSAGPRWCFTPTKDYLMSPGAVAVFEQDGALRMSLGEVVEKAPVAGRPSFEHLAE